MMLVLPAVDLRAGRVVRLLRGDFGRETVYDRDPLMVARRWEERGATLLHVVDLDGAREGRPVQVSLVREIVRAVPAQVGGGLRTDEDVAAVLDAGARRAVLGTAALELPLISALAQCFGDRLVVALDTRHGVIATHGWTESSGRTLLEVARELLAGGVRRFLHTDVERDGALSSPNTASLASLIALGAPVIASGGVSSLEDLRRLKEIGAEAVIVGRSLYDGRIDLQEAMTVAG